MSGQLMLDLCKYYVHSYLRISLEKALYVQLVYIFKFFA